jgi:DNA end-binding protein Ku
VKLYSAVSKQTVRFRELREDDGARVRHKRVAESDGEEVPYEQIVKGYEYAPDQYVVLGRDELAELDPQKTRAIEIQDFVDLDDIDPIYFEQPYYLGPDKGAERAYALLVQAMKEARKVAIARFVLRNKEHLAAIRPMGDVLTLTTMRFHDEVSSPQDLDGEVFEEAKPKKPEKRELEMAKQLIESLTSDFKPDRYRDEYREELLDLLERKAAARRSSARPPRSRSPPRRRPDGRPGGEPGGGARRGGRDRRQGAGKAQAQVQAQVEELQQRSQQEQHLSQEDQGLAAEVAPEAKEARPRGHGRPAQAQADQPRQGPLSEDQDHQGGGHRLLRTDR